MIKQGLKGSRIFNLLFQRKSCNNVLVFALTWVTEQYKVKYKQSKEQDYFQPGSRQCFIPTVLFWYKHKYNYIYTCSWWAAEGGRAAIYLPTAHNAFDSEVQVSVMWADGSSLQLLGIFHFHNNTSTSALFFHSLSTCLSLSSTQHHPFFSLVSVAHFLIQLTKMVENCSHLSWVSSLLHCLHKFPHRGVRQVPQPAGDGVGHTAGTGERTENGEGEKQN